VSTSSSKRRAAAVQSWNSIRSSARSRWQNLCLRGSPILTTGAFLPSTRAEDGDPLDVLIIHDAATYPGLVLKCKPIGVLEVVQTSKGKKERNDRVFVVPDRSPFEGDLQDIRRLPSRAIEELEKFFEATDALESKNLEFQGWRGPARAIKTIKKLAL
jgi:inorganic pyrophosphatase